MTIRISKYVAALITIVLTLSSVGVQAQTNVETFGQNRIQYRKFAWKFFDTKHFRIYHYDRAGRQLARYVSEQAENDIDVVEKKLGGQFPKRFNIVVYNSYDEYRQTNIGRKYDSQLQDIPAGTVDLVGDKLVVYFTGEHIDLRRQMRAGMSRVVMERMLFGESFREMVKNAVLLNLPTWTVNGFIAYLVDGWDTKANSEWKNMIAAKPNAGFYELAEKNSELAGKAFWKYVTDRYGDNNMKNLLYTMQLKSSLNQGLKMTLGMNVKKAYDSVMAFYKNVYGNDALVQQQPDSSKALIEIDIPRDNEIIRNIRVAPRGNDVAYVAWKNGEFKVYIQRTKDQRQRSVILEGGRKDFNEQPDPNYPLLAWSNTGFKLAILYKKGTETRLRIYNSIKAKIENYVIPANRFDRVLGITFQEDDDKLVFSAIKRSQTDLYEFTIRGKRMKNITDDPWDDVQPWFVSGGSRRGILFLSNRPAPNLEVPLGVNQLPTGPVNVFFYNTKTKRKELVQMSSVTTGTVSQPIQYGSDNYAYLYDGNGITNKYVVLMGRNSRNMDSAYAVPITNYASNIISHQYNPASNQVADVLQDGDQYKVYFKDLEIPGKNVQEASPVPTTLSVSEENKKAVVQTSAIEPDLSPARETSPVEPILQSGNVFQTEFEEEKISPATDSRRHQHPAVTPDDLISDDETIAVPLTNMVDTQAADSAYLKMRPQPYKLGFKPDFFTVRVDNSVLFNRYQSVSQNAGQYVSPPLGGMLTVSLDDVMENHRFTGGIRLPINFTGTTYFMQYENFTRRWDWGLLFLRTENSQNYDVGYVDNTGRVVLINEQLGKTTTTMVQGSATYPLDRNRSVKLHMGLREDKLVFKAQDTLSLSYDIPKDERRQYWTLSRAEYVFDNTIQPTLNIYNGFRYKFFAEYLYKLNGGSGCYNLGTDFRYYKKIYKNFILATRIGAAHSGGDQKILYFMGGVDNWINPVMGQTNIRAEKYAFQTLANNMRGYGINSFNGNTYALLNVELRLPVLTTFLKRPIQSGFLRHMQLVGFMDAGSAWNNLIPTEANIGNGYTLVNAAPNQPPSVILTISNSARSLGMGYGAGLRTMLFGYFLRVDCASSIEGTKPIWHFSIGSDF